MLGLFGPKSDKIGAHRAALAYQGPFKKDFSTGFRVINKVVLEARAGKVRLLPREKLTEDWDPSTDGRLTDWEVVQHLVRALQTEGETQAARLLARIGERGEGARDLAYRLYGICDRKKWAGEALAYNSLVTSWPEITRLAAENPSGTEAQTSMEF